ncbi:uncharacterized protein LAJ45_07739 [Morchella importuna]|uniref:uncharacterized protein n=1 Tax=Morchella importuna TaxID=1174673 RepID=UPI001E8E3A7A|nr:uncharacterized protein LAJ45_07739 [Morchella importuna]KAH8148286.1 hypothetical protein LAJ45_07739 [Morchella importuna]
MHSLLIGAVAEDKQPTVVSTENAYHAWKALKNLYDHVSPNTTITLLSRALDTKMQDNGNPTEHLETFNTNWKTLKTRCQSGDHKFAQALLPLTNSDEAMAAFLLTSLLKSMGNFIDNIHIKQDVTYEDVRQRLQNIQEETPLTGNNRVLHTRNTPTPNGKECTWCKKRNQPKQWDSSGRKAYGLGVKNARCRQGRVLLPGVARVELPRQASPEHNARARRYIPSPDAS